MRRLLVILGLVLAWSAPGYACEMQTDTRADNIADYIEAGQACLGAPPRDYRFDEAMEQAFVDKINAERAARDLHPLMVRTEMRAAARFHSLDMAVNAFFGHLSPARKSHAARIAAFDRTLLPFSTAENVAALTRKCTDWQGHVIACDPSVMAGSVDYQHKQLMANPDHRKNILSPDATHIALGVARNDQSIYVTQLFTRPAGVLDTPLPSRLAAGTYLNVAADIPDWRIRRLALIGDMFVRDLFDHVIPAKIEGDQNLSLKIERKDAMQAQFSYISGPAFTIIPLIETTPPQAVVF